ncbi:MAG: hypothetical protein WC047_07595, partial [Kiritimatiellales bacterium]
SCCRLLDVFGRRNPTIKAPFEKLLLSYALESIRAIRHLEDINKGVLLPGYRDRLAEALGMCLQGQDFKTMFASNYSFEKKLAEMRQTAGSVDGEKRIKLAISPAEAFEVLAQAIRSSASIWAQAKILFLLDDVSTRYLDPRPIRELISPLLFQKEICSFRLTTENQTLELALQSPGQIENAREGRDYVEFDLGADVYKRTNVTKSGKQFAIDILLRRAKFSANYPKHENDVPKDPAHLLGDTTLESIAREIAKSKDRKASRKRVYHGLSALASVCVGDIGDIIRIFEFMLKKHGTKDGAISPQNQNDSFLEFCSGQIYFLKRKNSDLFDFAQSFAQASHRLLMESLNIKSSDQKLRLRQYTDIYVRVTSGDKERQLKKLQELIDAGVFVLSGGSSARRSKVHDGDPVHQFKLTYRKVYGLSNFIGLGERDRFELSGEDLEAWLFDTNIDRKELLLKNQRISDVLVEDGEENLIGFDAGGSNDTGNKKNTQMDLSSLWVDQIERKRVGENDRFSEEYFLGKMPSVKSLDLSSLGEFDVSIAGIGFEDRSIASFKAWFPVKKAKKNFLISYAEAGLQLEFERVVQSSHAEKSVEIIGCEDIASRALTFPGAKALVDITALSKPLIYTIISNLISNGALVTICYTSAGSCFPLDGDIAKIEQALAEKDDFSLLEAMDNVLTGEVGPYSIMKVASSPFDFSRGRALMAFSSAKHERLFSLLDTREFDAVEFYAPNASNPRSKIAKVTARVLASRFDVSKITEIHTQDIENCMRHLMKSYHYWFVKENYEVELALTGSKLLTVAAALLSPLCKWANCWYVRPDKYSPSEFSVGAGATHFYSLIK